MVTEVVRSYWQIAGGLTDGTRQRAAATARAVLSGDVAATPVPGALGQVQSLTEELVAFAASNRALVRGIVAAEVDRALGVVGAASSDEVAALRRSVERLSTRVADLEAGLVGPRASSTRRGGPATGSTRAGSGGRSTSSTRSRSRAASSRASAAAAEAAGPPAGTEGEPRPELQA